MDTPARASILLADDEDGIRKVLGITLADLGYTVHQARDGQEALDLFRTTKPAIVLTDIKMPVMDGIELLRAIKAECPDTEVIMITGHGDLDLAVSALKLQASDFINKPINPDALEVSLARAWEKIEIRARMRQYTENLEALVESQAARLVEFERRLAATQVAEGLTSAFRDMSGDLAGETAGEMAGETAGPARFLNGLPCFVTIHGRDLTVASVNPLAQKRLGISPGDPSARVYQKAKGDVGSGDCPAARTLATGEPWRGRETLRCVNGNEVAVMVHTAPIRDQKNEVELILEIAVDVGEIKRLQEELRATQELYRQLFDEAPCAITLIGPDLRIAEANRRFTADFGEPGDRPCHRLYGRDAGPCQDCPVQKTFADGLSHSMETTVEDLEGTARNLVVWTAPVKNASGAIVQVMELATDITQVKRLQEHLAALGLLLASLSHGIKGLLTALDGGMYKVSSGFAKNSPDQVAAGWEVVQSMVGRIKGLVLDILRYAKKRELNCRTVEALSFAAEVAAAVEPKAAQQGVAFERRFDPESGSLEIDPGALSAALVNLLENAVDACTEDKSKPEHRIVFSVFPDLDHVIFRIHDNGGGMSPETLDKLFSLFFSSKGSRGTGLGLFIARQAALQHGGDIWAESEKGRGAIFTISLPRTLSPENRAAMNGGQSQA
jgi:signal transduction histidine kinase/FixJ family two-component response regulator